MAVHSSRGGGVPAGVVVRQEVREGGAALTLCQGLVGLRQQVRDGAAEPQVATRLHPRAVPVLGRHRGGEGVKVITEVCR